jgi:hypothetical protein
MTVNLAILLNDLPTDVRIMYFILIQQLECVDVVALNIARSVACANDAIGDLIELNDTLI